MAANELIAGLALLVFLAILIAWNFITDVIIGLTQDFGNPVSIPIEISALVFIGAAIVSIIVYLTFNE